MNMKTILKLMGTLALTTGATTSVVACGDTPTPIISMNPVVAKQLGLTTDDDGKTGTQAAKLNIKGTDDIIWTMDALTTAITANNLLIDKTNDSKATSQEAYDFITTTLKIAPKSGTSFNDGIFDKSALTAIKGEVTNIKPTLTKTNDDKDYAITAGTFNFQFANGKTKLGDNYTINLKTDATAGVIATTLSTIVATLKAEDTGVDKNPNISFKEGQPIPASVDNTTFNITDTTTDAAKQFTALNKLTNLEITAQVASHTHTTGTDWAAGDTLTISYKTTTVNFDATSVKTVLTIT